MLPLSVHDRLPLTCTRLGTCCHGHRIVLCPWEIARLAHGMGVSARVLRDERMEDGGTRLRADGPPGIHGPPAHRVPACTLYDASRGCVAHEHRPLACRLYPLGRQRHAGAIRYYHPGAELPCRALCPTVVELPEQSVGAYLATQDIADGEAAHDAYAAFSYGLVNAALVIADAGGITRAALAEQLATVRGWSGDERARQLDGWYDPLTIPELPATLPAGDFAAAHGHLLAERLRSDFVHRADGLADAARLEILLAVHLGSTVGADAAVMAALIAQPNPP